MESVDFLFCWSKNVPGLVRLQKKFTNEEAISISKTSLNFWIKLKIKNQMTGAEWNTLAPQLFVNSTACILTNDADYVAHMLNIRD